MVSPEMAMLSVFITPWMNPTFIQPATNRACRCMTDRNSSRYGLAADLASG